MEREEFEKWQKEYDEWNEYYSKWKSEYQKVNYNNGKTYFPNGYIMENKDGSKRLYSDDQAMFRMKMDFIGSIVLFLIHAIGCGIILVILYILSII